MLARLKKWLVKMGHKRRMNKELRMCLLLCTECYCQPSTYQARCRDIRAKYKQYGI